MTGKGKEKEIWEGRTRQDSLRVREIKEEAGDTIHLDVRKGKRKKKE